jgi:hypothetical protein
LAETLGESGPVPAVQLSHLVETLHNDTRQPKYLEVTAVRRSSLEEDSLTGG